MGAAGKSGTNPSTAASAVNNSTNSGPSQQMMRPGLNPSLRGFSPSKPYWKQGSAMPVSKQSGHKQQQLYGNNMHVPGPSQGVSSATSGSGMGNSSHPGVYTRSTKHTPSYKQ
jgi:hypothetical protein